MEVQMFGQSFANAYNHHLGPGYAEAVGPYLLDFYKSTPISQHNHSVLDVCCGTGQIAHFLLEQGYEVTGIDLSPNMLAHAEENTADYVKAGKATFLQANATDFVLEQKFGFVISTFDALNHLDSDEALRGSFRSVFDALVPGGVFIFDLNTRAGLTHWKDVDIKVDDEGAELLIRGRYDGQGDKAYMTFSGTICKPDGQIETFSETIFETIFELEMVRKSLLDIGWRRVYFARKLDLHTPLTEPELERKVFVVALK